MYANQAIKLRSSFGDQEDLLLQGGSFGTFGMIFDNIIVEIIDLVFGLAVIGLILFFIYAFLHFIVTLKSGGSEAGQKSLEKNFSLLKNFVEYICKKIGGIFTGIWKYKIRLGIISIIVLLPLFAFSLGFVDILKVRVGQKAINMKTGDVFPTGTHIIFPYTADYITSHIANYDFEVPRITADSKEPQDINFHIGVTFRLSEEKLHEFYQREGIISIWDTSQTIVSPRIIEELKRVVRNYSYKNILEQQDQIKEETLTKINQRLLPLGISVEELRFINIMLPPEYTRITGNLEFAEQRLELEHQRLEEEKLMTEREIEKAEREKQMKVIEAQGVVESNKILSQQKFSESLFQLRELEIRKQFLDKWDGELPDHVGGNIYLGENPIE
jgi:regulator of protease activity HflC (stomatin/prohibitin superfamily)